MSLAATETVVCVCYKSKLTGMKNTIIFEVEYGPEDYNFRTFLDLIFAACNGADTGIRVIDDEISTSLSVGDVVDVDIVGIQGTGQAKVLTSGWDIILNPIK